MPELSITAEQMKLKLHCQAIVRLMKRTRIFGGAPALALVLLFGLASQAEAEGYYVSWTNYFLRQAGQPPTNGTIWYYDDPVNGNAFTNLAEAVNVANGARVDLFINVPEECSTIEAAISNGVASGFWSAASGAGNVSTNITAGNSYAGVWTNVFTTIVIHSNTAVDSAGAYSNAAWQTAGVLHKAWYPKRGMTFRGEPRTNVTLNGGFFIEDATPGNDFTLDGLRFMEAVYSGSANSPRMVATYSISDRSTNICTIRNCYFGPLTVQGALYLGSSGGTTGPWGSYIVESNYFYHSRQLFLNYGSNVIFRGNYCDGISSGAGNISLEIHRLLNSTIENNTFANGAYIRGAGAPAFQMASITNYVINNNFIQFSSAPLLAINLPNSSNVTYVATNNWWGTTNGPHDQTNFAAGETFANTIEVCETNWDSENFRMHRNMDPEGGFDFYLDDGTANRGTTNCMYVPWATNWLNVNQWPEPTLVVEAWVGNHYTDAGPGASWFGGGTNYQWGINAFTNIQSAVTNLLFGGTVWLAPETFAITTQIVVNLPISIVGTQNVTTVTMTPGFTNRCFYLNDASARLTGIVISNGYASGVGAEGCGGGVYSAKAPSSFNSILDACRVVGCRADLEGGGVCLADSAATAVGAYINNTTISGNISATNGGGIACSNWLYLAYCTIDNNTAMNGKGGGVFIQDDTAPVTSQSPNTHQSVDYLGVGNVISNNTAKGDGGGAYMAVRSRNYGYYTGAEQWRDYNMDHLITDWKFVGNKSLEGSGGGAYAVAPSLRNSFEEGPYLFGCTFLNNDAGNNGGGLYVNRGRLDGCTFMNNAATNFGGGAYIDGLQPLSTSLGTNIWGVEPNPWMFVGMRPQAPEGMSNANHRVGGVSRCTFDGNWAGNDGGGMYVSGTNFNSRISVWGISNLANNVAENGSGGGIYAGTTNLLLRFIDGFPATDNRAGLLGGAICAFFATNTDLTFVSNTPLAGYTFSGNQAGSAGAIYQQAGNIAFSNFIFLNNRAIGANGGIGGYGGVISMTAGVLRVSACAFSNNMAVGSCGLPTGTDNRAGAGGGGPGLGGAISLLNGTGSFNQCIFDGNSVTGGVGGTAGLGAIGQAGGQGAGPAGGAGGGAGGAVGSAGDDFSGGGGGGANTSGGDGGLGGTGGLYAGNGGAAVNAGGGGGGGGAGLGGAIFSKNSAINCSNVSFNYNAAIGGVGGTGSSDGVNGAGCGGSIFAYGGAINLYQTTFEGNIGDLYGVPAILGVNGVMVGNGDAASLAKGTDFGQVLLGRVVTNALSITNNSTSALTIGVVTTNGYGAAAFQVVGLPTGVEAGACSNFGVTFDASAIGSQTCVVSIANNSGTTPYLLNLRGSSFERTASNGPAVGGNELTLTNGVFGNGSDITNVLVGGVQATILAQGANWVRIRMPAHGAGSVDIVIQSGSQGVTTLANVYVYNPSGSIGAGGVVPAFGNVAGSYTVTISGTNLCNGTQGDVSSVTLCGVSATVTGVAGSTQVVVTAGLGSAGLGHVRVFSMSHGETIRSNAFTYTEPGIAVLGKNLAVIANYEEVNAGKGTDFGAFTLGAAPVINTFAITNSGNQALMISGWTTNGFGSGAFVVSGMPATVSPGGVSNFTISFSFTVVGTNTATVALANNSGQNPFVMNLQGEANKMAQTITFPAIPAQDRTNSVTLSATASSGLPVSFWVVAGPGSIAAGVLRFMHTGLVYVVASQAGSATYLAATSVTNQVTVTQSGHTVINDYNGDSISELSVYDGITGLWYAYSLNSGNALIWGRPWGWSGAETVPGDYDGDKTSDLAVYDQANGNWYIWSENRRIALLWARPWGWPGAETVYGDYDGDAISDLAVYDQPSGYWYIITMSDVILAWNRPWGWTGAITVPGDYDGDKVNDLCVYDSYTGFWYVQTLAGTVLAWEKAWGWPGATTVPGDYDGDGMSDLAVYDQPSGCWYVWSLQNNGLIIWAQPWGWTGAVPVPGDYDGDGKDDLAVFDTITGYWYIWSLAANGPIAWAQPWGWPGANPPGGRE